MDWTARRAYLCVLFVSLVWLVLDAERLMEVFGRNEGAFEGVPCCDAVDAIMAVIRYPSFLALCLAYGARQARRWRGDEADRGGALALAACLCAEFVGGVLAWCVLASVVGFGFGVFLSAGVTV